MARVTATEVKEIIDTSLTDAQINTMITAANLTVTKHLGDQGLSSDLLKEIERWLSAHFCHARDPREQEKSIDSTRVKFQGQTGLGLDATFYGQQVKVLDPTGRLAKLGQKRATIFVSGEEWPPT